MTAEQPPAGGFKRSTLNARVENIFDHTTDTRSLFLSLTSGKHLRFVPGQFISITIPLGDEMRSRPYSIASDPEERGPFEICFNRVAGGRGVQWLFDRRVGDTLDFSGPFGTFTIDRAPDAELCFIAEGTAIAPIRPMLKRALASPSASRIHLIYAAPDRDHILYAAELEQLMRTAPNFSYESVIAPGQIYDRLFELADARWVIGDADRTRQFYICGVGKGVIRLRDLLRGAGYERRAVHYEQW
ncbi:MAG TPA: FAD-dependent oxidoreductase [Candidatus Binatus sp.]|uniref:ferredoxin--NADP reductase n=1 Tax=Candidatus Binatus sp. TaxID=2811406 RepID=UPI002F427B5E